MCVNLCEKWIILSNFRKLANSTDIENKLLYNIDIYLYTIYTIAIRIYTPFLYNIDTRLYTISTIAIHYITFI